MEKMNICKKKIAVISEKGERITYDELKKSCDEFSKFVFERSTIVILASNTLASLIGYLSCMTRNSVPLLLSETIDVDKLNQYNSKYKFNYMWLPIYWFEKNYKDLLESNIIVYKYYDYVLILKNENKNNIDEQLALLLTTSGTTGSNKLVKLSRKNILSNTKAIVEYLGINENDIAITSLPMNYTYGLSVINTHLYAGGTILLSNKPYYTKEFWRIIDEYAVTFFAGVPYTYEMIR